MIGITGHGKSSLINNVIGEDYLDVLASLEPVHVTPQHVHRELLINNSKYQCTFIELPDAYTLYRDPNISCFKDQIFKQITNPNQRECLERINLIIHVIRYGRVISKEEEFLRAYTTFFPKSISALVVTDCGGKNNAARTRIVEGFKSDERTKDIAASMGKGIYTIDFPNLNDLDDDYAEIIKPRIQKDVSQLHQVIEKSNDTVDVLKHGDTGCSII